jgi:hypothetical protein
MPKHQRRKSQRSARESGWLSTQVNLSPGNDTNWHSNVVQIPILQFSDTYNAIEIYKVDVTQVVGTSIVDVAIGSKNWEGSAVSAPGVNNDKTTLWNATIPSSYPTQSFDLTDDLGNGVLVPAEQFVVSAKLHANVAGVTMSYTLRYRLKKVSDADLITMINQYLVN